MFELFNKDSVFIDGGQQLAVCRAGHRNSNRQRCTVARKTNNTDIVAEILATELCTKPNGLGHLEYLLLECFVTEGLAFLATFGGQGVQVVGGGELGCLHGEVCGSSTDHNGQVVGRAGCRTEAGNLLAQEFK